LNLNQRPSKFWIYLPLYLLILWAVVAGCWRFLNPSLEPELISIEEPEAISETAIDDSHCFNRHCKNLSGVFELWPDAEIKTALDELNENCIEDICETCENEAAAVNSIAELQDSRCMDELFEKANEFHIEKLKQLPKSVFFYNSGVKALSSEQSFGLRMLLKAYQGLKNNYGVVVIGRASNIGNPESNATISKLRAKGIEDEIRSVMGNDFNTKYVYFGSKAPQLTKEVADLIGLAEEDYENIRISGSAKDDFSLRLNQSVLVVLYELDENPFGL